MFCQGLFDIGVILFNTKPSMQITYGCTVTKTLPVFVHVIKEGITLDAVKQRANEH